MQADPRPAGRLRARCVHHLAAALVVTAGLTGCASPAQPVPPPPQIPLAPAAPPPPPAAVAPPPVRAPVAADALLDYADRIRNMPAAELAQEIARLGDPQDSAPRLVQLAMALGAARTPANAARAQGLLQRVLGQNQAEAQALHPLARLLLAQSTEARRLEEQLERQNQQVRDAQKRIEQLNDRLEALRAIERSLPRPAAAASGAARP